MKRLILLIFVLVLLLSDITCQKRKGKKKKKRETTPPPTTPTTWITSASTSYVTTTELTTEKVLTKAVTTEDRQVVTDKPDISTTEAEIIPPITTNDWSKITTAEKGDIQPETTQPETTGTTFFTTTSLITEADEEPTEGGEESEATGTTFFTTTSVKTTEPLEETGTTFFTTGSKTGTTFYTTGSPEAESGSTTYFSGAGETSWQTTTLYQTTEQETTLPTTKTELYSSTPELTEAPFNYCPKHLYACQNRQKCIGRGHLCNGKKDCPGGDDEEDCPEVVDVLKDTTLECKSDEFKCTVHGEWKCLIPSLKCNGHHDCDEGVDEVDCAGKLKCPLNHWPCDDGERCYAKTEWCNGVRDCKDKSDESNCIKEKCPVGDWQCKNGDCIPDIFRCDGFSDCFDNSDENEKMCESF